MHKSQSIASAVMVVVMMAAAGCSSTTKFTSSWKAPEAEAVPLTGKRVVAVVANASSVTRQEAEDVVVKALTENGAQGVASYTMISDETLKDSEAAKRVLDTAGVDGALILKFVRLEEKNYGTPGMWMSPGYDTLYGYWGLEWYEPGYSYTDMHVTIESMVYSVKENKLMWGAVSETINPKDVGAFTSDVVDKVIARMRHDGVLK